jgi:hypothetical protein
MNQQEFVQLSKCKRRGIIWRKRDIELHQVMNENFMVMHNTRQNKFDIEKLFNKFRGENNGNLKCSLFFAFETSKLLISKFQKDSKNIWM